MSLLYCHQKENTAAWTLNLHSYVIKDSHSGRKNKASNCFFMSVSLECFNNKKEASKIVDF